MKDSLERYGRSDLQTQMDSVDFVYRISTARRKELKSLAAE